ncbi:hypothetical protein J4G43_026995 [Bradyrhizobium barranii subsp. barranii]|uniref:Uncharacterized protein n=1 Tax=Bradyrhizobium barranii subsp. barranii TaxID=2823807 RepID=A0A939S0A4_9BRAD|nr:hypothetical protein [Bradyrhizobium barranii]UEM08441.1 hypothetical protein J4G43_026995 [Bradyrhizobium barranii subsp. barranii]
MRPVLDASPALIDPSRMYSSLPESLDYLSSLERSGRPGLAPYKAEVKRHFALLGRDWVGKPHPRVTDGLPGRLAPHPGAIIY